MLGHLGLILLAVVGVHSQSNVQTTNTNGGSGILCDDTRCITGKPNAVCTNGECVCEPPYVWGDGNFACYRRNQVAAEVKNDPTLTNFQNVTVKFDYPCRYLITRVKQKLKAGRTVIGSCLCVVHGWNAKSRGKFYARGYDVACHIENTVTGQNTDFSVRKEGFANSGTYTYFESSDNNDFVPNGPWNDPPVDINSNGVKVKCDYDAVNNFANLNIKECGLSVGLRGYDLVERRNQQQIPGIYVGVNCAHHPKFLENDRVAALPPLNFGGVPIESIQPTGVSIPGTLLLRAFGQGVPQNQPGASPTCLAIGPSLDNCNSDAMLADVDTQCFWMLRQPRFIRCLDPNDDSTPVLDLVQLCIDSICTAGTSCNDVKNALIASGCGSVSNIQILADYVNGVLC